MSVHKPLALTAEQVEAFASLVDEEPEVVRERLYSKPQTIPLIDRAIDVHRNRRTAGMILSIGGAVLLQAGLGLALLTVIGSGICAGADSGSGDMCKDNSNTMRAGLITALVGFVGGFGGLIVLTTKTEAERSAIGSYQASPQPPMRYVAMSSPGRVTAGAAKTFSLPLLSFSF
jgi:hypothetical protein